MEIYEDPMMLPDLWERMPSELIDQIIDKVLIDLPFSRIHGFCFICKRYKDRVNELLLSAQYLLYYREGDLHVFNSRRAAWESVSFALELGQTGHDRGIFKFLNLSLMASDRGLVCLMSMTDNKLIVGNPLTKLYIVVPGPPSQNFDLEEHLRTSPGRDFLELLIFEREDFFRDRLGSIKMYSVVEMIVDSDSGHFKLITVSFFRRSTFVFDSRVGEWICADVPDDVGFLVIGPSMHSRGNVLAGVFVEKTADFKVVAYDVEQKRWRWVSTCDRSRGPACFPLIMIKNDGRALIGSRQIRNANNVLKFFEVTVQDAGGLTLTPLPSTYISSFETRIMKRMMLRLAQDFRAAVLRNDWTFSTMLYFGHGDTLFYVSIVRNYRAEGSRKLVLVWKYNRVDNSNVISNWNDWGYRRADWPDPEGFQILTPSLLRPRRLTQ